MKTFNKKIILSMMLAILLTPAVVSARVHFLEKTDDPVEAIDLARPCVLDYPKRSCPNGQKPQNLCPTDSSYFKSCGCDTTKYQYNASSCTGNKTLSGGSCGDKYETCACDTTKYKYDSTNCTGGKALSGNTCDGKYEACGCTAEYSKTCNTGNLIPTDANDSCDGKYKACKCPANYVTCDNGGEVGASQCTEETGTVKYSSCKAATCNSDEVNADTYFGGKLSYFMSMSGIRTVGSIRCIKLPTCESFGFTNDNCQAHIKCPFDKSKIWCPF